ncbi:carboxypeptidase-like regulatory domain-containing protein [Crateriforma conspicua]|uniref:Dioxygenase n=1 Tax=Crateriforma conspicua TaxID=2527996 RepID=A0A5C6G206_9PLAN|nr:carboxypeptidase-like regulatory domain-containing protein [Crateriforma conspicua]TWU67203.1 hypothetical protein V7x_27760 [Crateriforma conspicua]
MRRALMQSVGFVCLLLLSAEPASANVAQGDIGIAIAGTVTNESGDPIESAEVYVLGELAKFAQSMFPFRSPGQTATTTDANGNWSVLIIRGDQRFVQGKSVRILITAEGYQATVRVVTFARCLSGQPIITSLSRTSSWNLTVFDSAGQRVDEGMLYPANISGVELPQRFDDQSAAPLATNVDANGVATIGWTDAAKLSSVYYGSSERGYQRLDLSFDSDHTPHVVSHPVRRLSGELFVARGENDDEGFPSHPHFDGVKLVLATRRTGDALDQATAWCEATVDRQGRFTNLGIVDGDPLIFAVFPDDFPFQLGRQFLYKELVLPTGNDRLRIPLVPGVHVSGEVRHAATGDPIGGIFIDTHDVTCRPAISTRDGRFSFWSDEGRIGFYPVDAFGSYLIDESSYQYPQQIPKDRRVEVNAVRLNPMSSAKGRVVDTGGREVVGAEVACTFKRGRSTVEMQYFTDSHGQFRFHRVSDGTSVTLTARHLQSMTEQPITMELAAKSEVTLVLQPRFALRVVGRVVDALERPVKNARVQVRVRHDVQPENIRGRSSLAHPLFEQQAFLLTDADGRFRSPTTLDWDQPISLSVRTPGKRTFNTYWINAKSKAKQNGVFDFGDLRMFDQPNSQLHKIRVVNESGQSIPAARVVSIGARTRRAAGITDDSGKVTLQLMKGTQIIAAHRHGFLPTFHTVNDPAEIELLVLRDEDARVPKRTAAVVTDAAKETAAKRLLSRLPQPATDDPRARRFAYLTALAVADSDRAVARLRDQADHLRDEGLLLPSIMRLGARGVQSEQLMTLVDDDWKASFLLQQAEQIDDKKLVEQKLYQALSLIQPTSGQDALSLTGLIANALLKAGLTDVAVDLLHETWKQHHELQFILDDGERSIGTALSRTFAPFYAIVDLEKSRRLIELTALADEVGSLKAKADLLVAMYAPHQWEAIRHSDPQRRLTANSFLSFRDKFPTSDFQIGRRLLDQIEPDGRKARLLLLLARQAHDASPKQRLTLAVDALRLHRTAIEQSQSGLDGESAAGAVAMVAQWDAELAEQYAFEAFWQSRKDETMTQFNVPSTLAGGLGGWDRGMALALVEPCFDDWSWLFGERDFDVIFTVIHPLRAMAHIDPTRTVELVNELLETHLSEDIGRHYDVVRGVVNEFRQ